jgi:Zn finger protein HypA/HybF involved in hydrogenase expression
MCVYNGNTKEQIIDLTQFEECLKCHSKAKNILTGELLEITKSWIAPPKSVAIFDFLD